MGNAKKDGVRIKIHCCPIRFSTTEIISKISWSIRIFSIRKKQPACLS